MQSLHNRIIMIIRLLLLIITITALYILTSEMKHIISKYFKISGLHVGIADANDKTTSYVKLIYRKTFKVLFLIALILMH